MDTAFHVAGDPETLLATLFPIDGDGFIHFGFFGAQPGPCDRRDLLYRSVEIVDYVMEGLVTYLLSVERAGDGIRLIVRKTGTNRDEHVDWFVEKYITSQGLAVTKGPA